MRLKLRLTRQNGTVRDISITADAIASVGDVARTILDRDPARADTASPASTLTRPTLSVRFPGQSAATALAPETLISEAAIASGADIAVIAAPAEAAAEGPILALLRVVDGPGAGREFPLRAGRGIIGRDSSADIVLADTLVSKRHARVEVSSTVDIVDLNSANGIVVDGGEVPRVSLDSGQTVLLGNTLLQAQMVPAPTPTGTQSTGAQATGTQAIGANATGTQATGTGDLTAAAGRAAPAARVVRTGPVGYNRSPRVEARYPGEEFSGPDVPREGDAMPFPWIALVAPLIMGAVLFFLLPGRGIASFAFIALAPILMIGTFITQRLRERRRLRDATAKFNKHLQRLGEKMEKEVVLEREVRLEEAVSTAAVITEAATLGRYLWTRRPEHWNFLNVRLGIGTAPSRNTITGKGNTTGIAEYAERLDATIDYFEPISGVPIVDNLVGAGALGIAGGIVPATRAAHSVLVQLAGQHSPLEVSFTAIVGPTWAREFEWLKWLPHTGAVNSPLEAAPLANTAATGGALLAALEELILSRTDVRNLDRLDQNRGPLALDEAVMARGADVGDETDGRNEPPPTPCVVVLISDDAPVDRARLVSMVERAADAGILPVWIAERPEDLPAACRTFVELDETGIRGSVGMVRTGQRITDVEIETLRSDDALEFALGLASVVDAGALVADESDIPRSVSFVDLLGAELTHSSDAVIDRWSQNASIHNRTPGAEHVPRKAGKLRALVGQSASDALHLDLRSQGPHALVGGTTGAGKSEFLQAWVLGMAAEYSPDRVSFLFVDYKGGSAFADCVDLPHTVGLVTDLSPHLVRRALTSLRAELHFREHLFNRKKVKDLIELEKRGDPECPPALVLVIDEFAALVGEVPEFVDGVVDIAQRGRSLGIHLIMATQRPAGVIKDNLRANTNLRIALRMADESDSTDVIGTPLAAGFDPAVPGRGAAKTGPGRLTSFQTGYAGGWTTQDASPPSIEIANLTIGAETAWEKPAGGQEETEGENGPNDTARLVFTFVAAATAAGIPAPRKPWLDELAGVYDLSLLRQRTDERLVIGVTDDASTQSQYPVYFRPDVDGHVAIYGTGGTGKSVALRSLAVAAAITPRGGPMHVYGLDFASGGLRMLEGLPHVGAIIAGDDSERVGRLLRRLRGMIEERTLRYGAVRASTVAEYRTLANRPEEPRILLLVDGMATFRQEYEFTATTTLFNAFLQVLSDGRQVGIHVAVSADRPGSISPSVGASFQKKVILRLTDDNDYAMVNTANDVLSTLSPPGRAVVDDLETQVAVFGGTPNVAEQARAIDQLAATMRTNRVAEAPDIERLREQIPFSEIALSSSRGTGASGVLIGMTDDDLSPFAFVPEGAFMLTGPPASGRSSALALLQQSIRRSLPGTDMYYFGNAKSAIPRRVGWTRVATSPEDASALAKELLERAKTPATASTKMIIIVEAIADFLSTPADADLTALIKAAKRNDHFVVGEGENSSWSQSWPLLMELKSARRGFALQPEPHEGDLLFKTSFPRAKRSEFTEGRGNFVQAGKVRRVQLALPDQ